MEKLKKKILDDESLICNAKKVTEFRYIKFLRGQFDVLNGWPGKEIGEEHSKYQILRGIALIILNQFCFLTGLRYLILHLDNSLFELGHMIITLLMGCVSLSRILFLQPQSTKYRDFITTFLTKSHLLFFKDRSEYAMETHKKVHFISHVYTIYVAAQMFFGIILFNCIPIWSNFSAGRFNERILYNSTYDHSLYLSVPVLKIYTHFDAYVIGCIYNWLMSYLCSASFCMVDLCLSLIVFNLWGHFKILLHDLATFPLPVNKDMSSINDRNTTVNAEMYSEEDFTDQMSEAFGPTFLIFYTFHQISGCLLLFECSQMTTEALMRYCPLTFILFQQLIVLSVIIDLIGSTSGKLKDAVYGIPWQYMDTKNRKTVSIFLYNAQEPIHVVALGVVPVGVTTMAAILKTSLSYFAFLLSM